MPRSTGTSLAATAAAAAIGSSAFVLSSQPSLGAPSAPRLRSTASAAGVAPESGSFSSGAAVSAAGAAVVVAAAASRRQAVARRAVPKSKTAASAKATESEAPTGMSMAMPFAPVPPSLTNDPYNNQFPGDFGFDPLGFTQDDYLDEVAENFGIQNFNKLKWYREAELMHGRAAMLATLNLVVRATPLQGVLPDSYVEQKGLPEFLQVMAMLEAYRGYRLLLANDGAKDDMGYGAGNVDAAARVRELAEKQFKELMNGRLAMIAITGIGAQYMTTGRTVGMDFAEFTRIEDQIIGSFSHEDDLVRSAVLTVLFGFMAFDGARRLGLAGKKGGSLTGNNTIAQKAINPFALKAGVQNPNVALPAGVVAGQMGQRLELTEEQIRMYEEDGVIMIKGAMKPWVSFLRSITEFQIENPHIWSLVGRMSGLYDYIQRNMWMTNDGFRDFLYYSPLGHCLAQLGRTEEVRCTTDMLLVNPNKGFGWHQDNQNGPIDFPDAMRWWVAMDKCGENDYGAPEYICGSHRNKSVSDSAVFVNLDDGDLLSFPKKTKYIPEPGDLIIWNARTIHRIVAPPDQEWTEGTQRRAIGGTVAKGGTIYYNKGGASGISDLAGHTQVNGEKLGSPYFPRIYPSRVPEEEAMRNEGKINGRDPQKIIDLGITLASNASKYMSFTKVVGKKD
jgi:hypothetical protein